MTFSTLISGISDQDLLLLLLLLQGHHGCPPPPGADADEESCSFIRYQLKLAAKIKAAFWGGTVAIPPKIGLREAVQRMLFCTTDEQIESFMLPFQRKGRDVLQISTLLLLAVRIPAHLLDLSRCRQQEVIIAER